MYGHVLMAVDFHQRKRPAGYKYLVSIKTICTKLLNEKVLWHIRKLSTSNQVYVCLSFGQILSWFLHTVKPV